IGNEAGATRAVVADADNTWVGFNAGAFANGSASGSNTGIGAVALDALTTGINCTAVGRASLSGNQTGNDCTAVGKSALLLSTGANNTVLGSLAGDVITSGSDNTMLGKSTDPSANSATNQICIGVAVVGTANDQCSIGKSGAITSNDFGSDAVWTQTSDFHRKNIIGESELGLSFINELVPVKYTLKPASELPKEWNIDPDMTIDTEKVLTGLVAQDVKAAIDKHGVDRFAGWSEGPDGQRIGKEAFIFPLINAINELTAEVETLKGNK
ncbi:hypothetical protein LCGC14_2214930, partial [marine sediment metagenome]